MIDYFSKQFIKTFKEDPKDEFSTNAKLLIRAGYLYKEMAGVYALLPLGLKVIEKIKAVVRDEMDEAGGQELIMTSLQQKELWEKTDRWDDEQVDVWFKARLKNGGEVGFAWSHEEQITNMMKSFVQSYRDLPRFVYQFQTKLRNEVRAKSGIMRCREFVMKDLYSYSKSNEDHEIFYNNMIKHYHSVFKQLGLGETTFLTVASGGAFTKFSHEFQTICDAGEDIIYLDRKKNIAVNQEVLTDDVLKDLGIIRADLEEVKAAEVGNIFSFGATKSEQLGLQFSNENGEVKPVILGSYGIGITRLMGVIVEKYHDDKGIVWPKQVAPYDVTVIDLLQDKNNPLYKELLAALKDQDTLIDDRTVSAGEKLADADLLGLPLRIVISKRTVEQGGVAVKLRSEAEEIIVPIAELKNKFLSK